MNTKSLCVHVGNMPNADVVAIPTGDDDLLICSFEVALPHML